LRSGTNSLTPPDSLDKKSTIPRHEAHTTIRNGKYHSFCADRNKKKEKKKRKKELEKLEQKEKKSILQVIVNFQKWKNTTRGLSELF
jgi:hypothetical protein